MRTIDKIRCINESHSVADNIIEIVDDLLASIEKNYINYQCERLKNGTFRFGCVFSIPLWGQNITFDLTIYDFMNSELCEDGKGRLGAAYFDAEHGTIKANVVMLFGKVCRECSETILRHELEHCYQWALNKTNNPNFITLTDEAYKYASKIVVEPKGAVDPSSLSVAWVIYYGNPREQDAYIQEYYAQAKEDPFKFRTRTTDVDKRIAKFGNMLKTIEADKNDPSMQSALAYYEKFGYTADSILEYGKRGYKRFVNKRKHVTDRLNIELGFARPSVEGIQESIEGLEKKLAIKALAQNVVERIMENLRKNAG
ncbi:MAG: hypothetical protein LUD72_04770 [Bacteroidales bacterium]|nr:hypothetical protein [Bacteroidales bacterium]